MTHPLTKQLTAWGLDRPAAIVSGATRCAGTGPRHQRVSPIDHSRLAELTLASADQVAQVVDRAQQAFVRWRVVPAPRRGELVRQFGQILRHEQALLAELVSWETGKILSEARGEVQEMIDVCDFAVGLSRQLYGLTIASERPGHRLMEQWHPLGPVAVISAFNFPVAVWAWNAALAWVCGDPVIWKPSEKTPLCALACQALWQQAAAAAGVELDGLSQVVVGGSDVGAALCDEDRIPLVSATGSTRMGRAVAERVARRLGRSLLELGGNNGLLVCPSADLELALRAIVFAAVGTCGQRCTTLRRLIVHASIADTLVPRLVRAYESLPIGDPLQPGTLVGPLIDQSALSNMRAALSSAVDQGGRILMGGERVTEGVPAGGYYVRPAIVAIDSTAPIVQQETFAPILYVMTYCDFATAIDWHNSVRHGLASAIFTQDVREAELFCSPAGSDCGIANVNLGTSGAEIGGAFGGEKDTGGGRESGSDAWKAYMRRATNTINYSSDLPLAQGIRFGDL